MQTTHPYHTNLSANRRTAVRSSGRLALLTGIGLALAGTSVQAERSYVAWGARKNTPTNESQQGVATAMDRRGNVFATGAVFIGGKSTIFTAKYDGLTGDLVWQKEHSAATATRPVGLVVDSLGNAIMTGVTPGIGGNADYVTIKYKASDGEEEWAEIFNNPAANGKDEPVAIGLDALNNVYVTGKSEGVGTNEDVRTVKYNAQGVEQWVATYNSVGNFGDVPLAMAVGADGSVAVTGSSMVAGNRCVLTVRYTSTGQQVWAKTFDGQAGKDDAGHAVEIAPNGDVYVAAGISAGNNAQAFQILQHNGVSGFISEFVPYVSPEDTFKGPTDLEADANGDLFITAASQLDGFSQTLWTAKYDGETRQMIWDERTSAPDLTPNVVDYVIDAPVGLAVDPAGNVVVGATSRINNATTDYYVVKYDGADGMPLWEHRINGDREDGADVATGFAVDPFGNVALTGRSRKPAPSSVEQMLTVKFNRFLLSIGDRVKGFTLTPEAFISGFNVGALADNGTVVTKVTEKVGGRPLGRSCPRSPRAGIRFQRCKVPPRRGSRTRRLSPSGTRLWP